MIIKYNTKILQYIFLILIFFYFPVSLSKSDEISIEEVTIKKRKAIFSKNYSTAKKVQIFVNKNDFDNAKILMIEMSENYLNLISLFPGNTKNGFNTEALTVIWENKDEFNSLMKKSSSDMIKLASNIETAKDVKSALNKMMWSNCKACHSKFRAPH